MKNDHYDILALLLAAEEHPHLKDKPEFREARERLEASASLQAELAECRAFFQSHPALVRIAGMPDDTRERIGEALRRGMGNAPATTQQLRDELSPWTVRTQFAWAAVLVLLLAGMAVMSSSIIQQAEKQEHRQIRQTMAPRDAFHSYALEMTNHRLPLQERDPDSRHLVNWLHNQGAEGIDVPARLAERESLGCAYLEGPHGKVSLICFGTETGIVHLFVAPSRQLELREARPPKRFVLDQREALRWNDAQNAYLMLPHKPGQALPDLDLDKLPTAVFDPESPRRGEMSLL